MGHFTKDCEAHQLAKQREELRLKLEQEMERKRQEEALAAQMQAETPASPTSPYSKEVEFKPPTAEELARMAEISRAAQEEAERLEREREMAVLSMTLEQRVERFYAKCRPERRNLFKELASASTFVIEGDSLLLEALSNSLLDTKCGGQTLAVIFQVERLLHNLLSREANFDVVFFQCHTAIWAVNQLGALLREILIHHLKHACKLPVHVFPNYWCDEWNTFLEQQKPGFIMSTDAEQSPEVCMDIELDVQFLFRAFLIHCVSIWQLHCVFTSRIVFRGSKADVWVIRGHSSHGGAVDSFYNGPEGAHEKVKGLLDPTGVHFSKVLQDNESHKATLDRLLKSHASLFATCGFGMLASVAAASELLCDAPEAVPFLKAVLLHQAIRAVIPLEWRAQRLQFAPPPAYQQFVNQWLGRLTPYVASYACGFAGDQPSDEGTVDVFDGRLLAHVLGYLDGRMGSPGLPATAVEHAQEAWAALSSEPLLPLSEKPLGFLPLPMESLEADAKRLPHNSLALELGGMDTRKLERPKCQEVEWKDDLCFHIWDLTAEKNRKLDMLDDVIEAEKFKLTRVEDRSPNTEAGMRWKKKKEEQRKQIMANLLSKHATSLEGGTFLAPGEILTAKEEDKEEKKKREKEEKKKEREKEKEDKKKSEKEDKKKEKEDKKKKPEKESLKDKIKRENEAAQVAKLLEKETKRWTQFKSHLDKDPRKGIRQIDTDFLKKCEHPHVALEGRFHLIKLRMDIWKTYCAEVETNRSYLDACLLLLSIRDAVDIHKDLMEKPKKVEMLEYLLQIGLKDCAASLGKELNVPLPDTPVMKSLDVGMSAARLQMEHMGHLLARPVSDVEDTRVGFRPDLWQQHLLDIIDNNESALICAPTSSGKTFISYYCMKKVLKSSDDGLVIFCAPNKQLAHQVKADVYAHFRTKTFKNPPWTLYGEYSSIWENVDTCQILVTSPDMLQTLLTDVKLYSSISKRLQYLIVDEVHCIDELEDGALWERLLMLTRCPFLALSATIGNIDAFHGWLQRCQDVVRKHDEEEHHGMARRGYKVHKVPDGKQVKEISRWSDLQKYLYIPKNPEARAQWMECRPKVSKQAFGQDTFHPIHPCSCLTTERLAANGFPGDLGFVPRESTALFDRMMVVAKSDSALEARMVQLVPETYFKGLPNISQMRAREYEKVLKEELQCWSQDPARQPLCDKVLAIHHKDLNAALQKVTTKGACQHQPDTEEWLAEHFIHLLTSLAAEDKLPVLVFNFEETSCENLAEKVVEFLEAKETEHRSTPEFKKKMQDLTKRQKEAEARAKKHEKLLNNKKDEEANEQDDFLDLSDLGDLREREVLPQFTFVRAHEGEGLDEEELADIMKRVEKDYPKDHILHRSLLRGIGVHHFGLPYNYRQSVEMLFRAKHIKCVISTETMALGIHMPCRSVVFAGDHLQLNPLQFRQMSGRAGRRGFDLLGHVIFFGVPEGKVNRLMTSEIQSLKGHWPLTSALVHRLLALYSHPNCKEKVQKRVQHQMNSLWQAPLITIGMPVEDVNTDQAAILRRTSAQVQLYFSTIVDCLMANGFLGARGEVQSFADMAAKLYRYEPSQFLFVALLKQGVFHEVTTDYHPLSGGERYTLSREEYERRTKTNEQCLEKLLLLLCHILARREIHRSVLADRDIDSETVHQVYLPSMDNNIQATIDAFSHRTMACFTAHVINAARQVKKEGHKDALPLSRIVFERLAPVEKEGILTEMEASAIPFEAKSPFVAMCGHGDVYETQAELAMSVRDGVYVDPEVIPTIESRDTSLVNNGSLLMNAVVFDYQHSSSQDDVLKWNGLNYKESWEDLERFHKFLMRIVQLLFLLEGADGSPPFPPQPKTRLLMCLFDLWKKCDELHQLANNKALSKQDRRKQTSGFTQKKPKRPPLIKRDPRQGFRRR
eukprot:GGOE01004010.1.p1 GENE.GGOE01004010.1~~GGOE01004010.1.p1  ORF type:complete len:2129 (-),score=578.38 GGOE01004010.1:277-6012(-)